MVNVSEIISFERPDGLVTGFGIAGNVSDMPEGSQHAITRALEEIASTREGAALIERALETSPDGKLRILANPSGISGVQAINQGVILLGNDDSTMQYYSEETGSFHNMSIQRLLVHELSHMANGHIDIDNEEKMDLSQNQRELEAIQETNEFMYKYYREPPRGGEVYDIEERDGEFFLDGEKLITDSEDGELRTESGRIIDLEEFIGGRMNEDARGWEFNPNFQPDPILRFFQGGEYKEVMLDMPGGQFDGIAGDPTIIAAIQEAGMNVSPQAMPEPEQTPFNGANQPIVNTLQV